MSAGPEHAQGGTPAAPAAPATPATPPAPAAPVTPPDAAARIADCLADLADTLHGWGDRFDAAIAKDEQDEAARAARDRRREPAEWQAALDTFRQWLYSHVHGDTPMTEDDRTKADEMLDGIVTSLDDTLRSSGNYSLRYALECLSRPNPPQDSLADIAAQRARSLPTPEERELYARAWLDGATREETG